MASNDLTLLTETDFLGRAVRVTETPATGRRALTFPSGATVEAGDTGWVDFSGAMINGWTATTLKARRTGYTTVVRFAGLNRDSSTSSYWVKLPAGFVPTEPMDHIFALSNKVLTVWINDPGLSIQASGDITTSTMAQIQIPVPGVGWPTALGGAAL